MTVARMGRWALVWCTGLLLLLVRAARPATGAASARFTRPPAYARTADGPFSVLDFSSGYFYLESFEDGAFNTPGASASGGTVAPPGPDTDSVDADDGQLDGQGTGGHS